MKQQTIKYTINQLLIILIALFFACSNNKKKEDDICIVSSFYKDSTNRPKITTYYTNYNFIVDSIGQLFYYQLTIHQTGCSDVIPENPKPLFMNIQPSDIVQIPESCIGDFVKLNVLINKNKQKVITISSMNDTIKSKGFKILKNLLDTAQAINYWIRPATPEEKVVLTYKQKQMHYNPDEIYWDSSKTLFYPKKIIVSHD